MWRPLIGAALAGALVLSACGDDDPSATPADDGSSAGFDDGFGTAGVSAVPMSTTENDRVTAVALDGDGRMYAAGFVVRNGDAQLAVLRVDEAGRLDPTFGDGGVASVNASVGRTAEVARSVVIQSDGGVVIAGAAEHDGAAAGDAARDTDMVVARFDDDGRIDTGFGTNGVARIDLGAGKAASPTQFTGDTAWGLGSLSGDKLVVWGTKLAAADRSDADFVMVGLTRNGAVDSGFGTNGVTTVDLQQSGDTARNLKVLGDHIVATGYSNRNGVVSPVLVRTSLSGRLDASFGDAGVANHTILAGVTESYQVDAQGDDYVLAGYGRGADPAEKVDMVVYRFTADGEWDKAFGTDGVARIDNAGEDDRGRDLAVLGDGRVVIVGSGKLTAAKVQPMVVVLDEDGTPSSEFGSGGRIVSDFGGPADSWYGVALSDDGRQAHLAGFKGVDATSGGNDDAVVGLLGL